MSIDADPFGSFAVGHFFNDQPIYKFGITSARLESRRIKEVARFANMEFEIVVLAEIKGKAFELEANLKKLGSSPKYRGFNGASEFRALSDADLQTAISLIENHQKLKKL